MQALAEPLVATAAGGRREGFCESLEFLSPHHSCAGEQWAHLRFGACLS